MAAAYPVRLARDSIKHRMNSQAAIAQLGECQTEDLKVPGSIPGLGNRWLITWQIQHYPTLSQRERERESKRASSSPGYPRRPAATPLTYA